MSGNESSSRSAMSLSMSMSTTSSRSSMSSQGTGNWLVNETERACCSVAVRYFEEEDYQECSDLYTQVLENRNANGTSATASDQYRLKQNILVSKFLEANCIDVDTLYRELRMIFLEAKIKVDDLNFENIEEPILLFNMAVLYFHHKQYDNALSIVEKMSHNLFNIMDAFSKRVKLLHIDVLLKLQQFDKAVIEIEHLESQLKSMLNCSSSVDFIDAITVLLEQEAEVDYGICERLQQMKTLCCLGTSSPESGKIECDSLLNISNFNKPGALIAFQMKARNEFLSGNPENSTKLLLKLQEAYRNHFWETGDDMDITITNNLGCSYFSMGKPNVACQCFDKASLFCDKPGYKDKKRQPLPCRAYNKKYEIIYNMGIGLLQINQPPFQTYSYLSICRKPFSSNPRLWLRIAECCIKIHMEHQDTKWATENQKVLNRMKEDFRYDKSFLETVFQRKNCLDEDLLADIDDNLPEPTLKYALECIAKALQLIQSDTVRVEGCLFVKPSRPITSSTEISQLHASVLCTGAYLACLLQNYRIAISYCETILRLANIPEVFTFLAKMYLGEALFKISKMDDSLRLLNDASSVDCYEPKAENAHVDPECSCSISTSEKVLKDVPYLDRDRREATMAYNRSIVLVKSGRLNDAIEVLETWITSLFPSAPSSEFIILALDIFNKLGNLQGADDLLRRCTNLEEP